MASIPFLLPGNENTLLEKPRAFYHDRCVDSILFAGCDNNDRKFILYMSRKSTYIKSNIHLQLTSNVGYSKSEVFLQETTKWCTVFAKLESCEPMNTWRIACNGSLNNSTSHKLDHVKINLLFHPLSSPVYFDKNRNLTYTYHRRLKLKEESIFNLLRGYEQWGSLHGMIQINGRTPIEINLSALKKRYWSLGRKDFLNVITFSSKLMASFNSFLNLRVGHIRTLKKHEIATECDLKFYSKIPSTLKFQFLARNRWYKIKTIVEDKSIPSCDDLQFFTCTSGTNNDETGFSIGFILYFKKKKGKFISYIPQILPPPSLCYDFTVDLDDSKCWDHALVGGKGAYLSNINYYLARNACDEDFIHIPHSFFLTVNAVDVFIRDNPSLGKLLNTLKYGFYEIPESQWRSFTSRMLREWESSKLNSELIALIVAKIDLNKRYAIRWSGVYDGPDDIGAAEQNCSFLNISGIWDIIEGIKLCWASAYSADALQYRRNHGLPLVIKMGVIIQEMIDVELTGVMRTCHPRTNDTRYVSTSLSGRVKSVLCGNENELIIEKEDLDTFNEADLEIVGLTNGDVRQRILKLLKLCLEFEEMFNHTVNIEWGVVKDQIYIFQTSPAATLFKWSDFEICHELDSGFAESDAITFHNNDDVLSEATSPLSITFVNKVIERAFHQFDGKDVDDAYHKKLLAVTQFHTAMDLCNGLLVKVHRKMSYFQQLMQVVTCGQTIVTPKLYSLAQSRNPIRSEWTNFCTALHIWKLYMQCDRQVNKVEAIAKNFKIDARKFFSPDSLLENIIKESDTLLKIAEYHFNISAVCTTLHCITLWYMSKGDEKNLQKHAQNLSMMLEEGSVLPSQVANLIEEIANLIINHDKGSDYIDSSFSRKLQWIYEKSPNVYVRLQQLMTRFGFRCVNEMDLMQQTWAMNPEAILESIDLIIAAKDKLESRRDDGSKNLVSVTRAGKLVDFLIARTKIMIEYRERSRSCFILALNQFRLAFRRLGALMVENALIPRTELVFFHTLFELKQMIQNEDKRAILHKSYRRFQLWNHLESLKFDSVIVGLPHPVAERRLMSSTNVLKGISISPNSCTGRAFVLPHKKNMKNIKPGDIVVTRNIDFGWTIYFPLAGGIVTELAGIMSFGVIAARQRGLPCIVGVSNVTSYFETGDVISISGVDGTVRKLM